MSLAENRAIVGRWFTEFWGKDFNPAVIDESCSASSPVRVRQAGYPREPRYGRRSEHGSPEVAAPDMRLGYSPHAPCRGRAEVRAFAARFRAAFPDPNFWGTADLIAEGDYVVGRFDGGGTHTGDAFDDWPIGSLPAATGKILRFTGTTVYKVENGLITGSRGAPR